MFKIAKIAVDKTALHFDKAYDYYIPTQFEGEIFKGQRVTVPFGNYNHRRLGLVLDIFELDTIDGKKPINSIIDETPLLNDELLKVLLYLKEYTFCSYFDALKAILPSGIGILVDTGYMLNKEIKTNASDFSDGENHIIDYLKHKKEVQEKKLFSELNIISTNRDFKSLIEQNIILKSEFDKRRTMDEKISMLELCENYDEIVKPKITVKQKSAIDFLREAGSASLKETCYYSGVTRSVIDNLIKAELINCYEEDKYRNPYENADEQILSASEQAVLNDKQETALQSLIKIYKDEPNKQALLYGVTGSGKTEVFLKLVKEVISTGKKVIVLVPEIALTPQTVQYFHTVFGKQVAVMHSGLSMSQRLDEWKRIKDGNADIVVGTRTAVFAPLENLGLIVIDEEQEHTYKSESAPRFHARDVAKLRCKISSAMLVLASATPSTESYYFAKSGKYHLVTLEERFTGRELPDVYIVDMKNDVSSKSNSNLSDRLIDELYINLQKKEQSILLLNRRGYTTTVKCGGCAEVQYCPNCSISLTYHTANNRLMCHYCGYSEDLARKCSICGSDIVRYTGVGTQKLEEQLTELFPDARILRMDMDTTMTRFSHEKKFSAFREGEYDIMIGTQMVAKGLNFPKVTLVGAISADQSLFADDFRCLERSFSLLTQVVGRCGRGELQGRAFIQTYSPENHVIELASEQNYTGFWQEEIDFRKIGLYPPFCDIFCIGFLSVSESEVRQSAISFAKNFEHLAKTKYSDLPIRMLGPSESAVFKASGRYRYKLILKCRMSAGLRELLNKALTDFYADKANKNVTAFIDTHYDGNI